MKGDEFLQIIIEAMPSPVFVVDEALAIVESNLAGTNIFSDVPRTIIGKRYCEAQQCIHASREDEGFHFSKACKTCKLKNSVERSFKGQRTIREAHRIACSNGNSVFETTTFVTTTPFKHQAKTWVLLVIEEMLPLAMSEDKLPVCANCKKIRNNDESWEGVDQFLKKHLNLMVSHGLCPECARLLYSKLD